MQGFLWRWSYHPGTWFTNGLTAGNGFVVAQPKKPLRWFASRLDTAARSLGSRFLRVFQRKPIWLLILLNQVFKSFQVTAALPITESQPESDNEGFINYFSGRWHHLKDHCVGPMVENTGYACLLTGAYYGLTYFDGGLWKGSNLLEIVTTATSFYSYFLGNGEWLSDPQVAMVASLNLRLSVKVLQQKSSRFPKFWMQTVFCIVSASLGSAGILAKCMPVPGGRYKNPWVQAAMLLPLTNMFFTAFWIIFIQNSGVAKGLEEKTLWVAIFKFFQKRSLGILALVLIFVLLAKI